MPPQPPLSLLLLLLSVALYPSTAMSSARGAATSLARPAWESLSKQLIRPLFAVDVAVTGGFRRSDWKWEVVQFGASGFVA